MSQSVDFQSCHQVLERIEAWIDGDLGQAEAAAIENHIDRCDSCRAVGREAEELVSRLRSLPEFTVPERVLRTVGEATPPSVWVRLVNVMGGSVLRPLAAAAAVVVVVLVFSPWRGLDGPRYTEQEVVRATEETKLALAYVGSITRRAETRVKENVLDQGVTAVTVRGVNRSLKIIGEAVSTPSDVPVTPRPHTKGS